MRNVLLITLATLLIVGCGRKEPPQAWMDKGEPRILSIEVINAVPSKKLNIELGGGEGGVGYQLERAEIDPICKCPSTWGRYYEEPPTRRNEGKTLQKMIRLDLASHQYVYRLRAIDALGRLSDWSQTIQLKAKKAPESKHEK